ncbi:MULTISPECIES: DUF3613 domain-containing protein [Burkholderia cepacia complex]|uniref:DUF3613 domain-containing protein n=2 Tax=Burkholderia cepacia complex TaxID=87882 RepID=A0ABZ3BLZ7_BURPY|nr:DUF3613 domain-containing protein [Burkholderia stabilis]BAX57455.1 hypothetical protein BSFP_002430 [Burkholderia stabilis]
MKNRNIDRVTRSLRAIVTLALLGTAAVAHAQSPVHRASEIGLSTNEWLALQRDNQAAGPDLPMLGAAASLTYQRYLDSFKNKIPEMMDSPLKSVGGAGAGGQGMSSSSN